MKREKSVHLSSGFIQIIVSHVSYDTLSFFFGGQIRKLKQIEKLKFALEQNFDFIFFVQNHKNGIERNVII